jgi:hypothetical protein
MCILPPAAAPATPARLLPPPQRQQLARDALTGQNISQLAQAHDVSRKFVYQQAAKAEQALDNAFAPSGGADRAVLFHLPVTKAWLHQLTLSLLLVCHSSYRGVSELLGDLFDYPLSVGTVHNIVQRAVARARVHNDRYDLSAVGLGAHDEIFQAGWPVLVGADVSSTFCYLLSHEEHRDTDTWARRLRELVTRGFQPAATIADAAAALRAGQALALPGTPCRGDVFHALYEIGPVVRFLENRAYDAIAARSKLERQQAQAERRQGRRSVSLSQKLRYARPVEAQAIGLAEDVALLLRWLREDILAVAGPGRACRQELYDFVVAELRARLPLCPHRLQPVCTLLANQRDDLLAFADALDRDLADLAAAFQISVSLAREVLTTQALDCWDERRWPREAALQRHLGARYHAVCVAVADLTRRVVRASSVIENLNSRLRNYFFLRRQLGPEYLTLLQFFLNHRRFLRSEHPEREGHSPAELLTGAAHPHWLEMLGYTRFTRP